MSSPYRDLDGDPCPRCGSILVAELGDLVCVQGCGAWVPRAELITLLGDVILRGTGAVPYWEIEPLPRTACFRCAESLDAVYAKLDDSAIAFGRSPRRLGRARHARPPDRRLCVARRIAPPRERSAPGQTRPPRHDPSKTASPSSRSASPSSSASSRPIAHRADLTPGATGVNPTSTPR